MDYVWHGLPSSPLDRTQVGRRCAWNARIVLGQHIRSEEVSVACHHRPWTKYTGSDDIERYIVSLPLGSTHGRTTSSVPCPHGPWAAHMVGVACHHRPWAAHMVRLLGAWHAIIAFEHPKRMNNVESDMTSLPLYSTHGRMTSSMACDHRPWIAHTIGRCQAWNAIISFRQHAWTNNIGRVMPSSPWTYHTVERRRAWYASMVFG